MNITDFIPWAGMIGLMAERAYKMYASHKAITKDEKVISITEGDSLMRRANEMLDRLEKEVATNREEATLFRDKATAMQTRAVFMESQLAILRRLLRDHGIAIPPDFDAILTRGDG